MTIPGAIITEGPADWQIIQRDDRGLGEFTVRGKAVLEGEWICVQVRLVREDDNVPVAPHLDWHNAVTDRESGAFSRHLQAIPAGGLYRLETRIIWPVTRHQLPGRGDCIHHLGIGDIYVIAGQSNASGTGKGWVQDGPQLGIHLFGNDERWKLAVHPLEDATGSLHPATVTGVMHGHSPWLAFAKRILAETGIPVGLIPAALGGSSLESWINEDGRPGYLFNNMEDMIAKAGNRIAGVLWYQGESDAILNRVDGYAERFTGFVNLARQCFHSDELPVLTGQLNSYTLKDETGEHHAAWSAMRRVQYDLCRRLPHVYMIVTVDSAMSDVIHNNAAANVAIGERFAATALGVIYGKTLPYAFPEIASAILADDGTRLHLHCTGISGRWTPVYAVEDFTVEDEHGFIPVQSVDLQGDNDIVITLERAADGKTLLHTHYGMLPRITLRDDACHPLTPCSIEIGKKD